MKTHSLTFTAGQTKTLLGGNFFIILTTTSPVDVEFFKNKVSTDEKAEAVLAGFSIEPLPGLITPGENYFDRVKVTSALAQTVVVAVSRGAGKYQRTVGTVDVNSQPDLTTLTDTPDKAMVAATATLIAAAAAGRKELILQSTVGNTNSVRIGGSTVSATRGILLAPGAAIVLSTSAAVWGFSAGTDTIEIVEIKD